ncbi:hypothetical protein WJX72_008234 [[Myrmecia] bisecta]|uniref:AIG1-type G domain-containing protein n=1 Tax=[Myrmecia] bisecta TaxID=41462 RepID=A0AAW1Q4B4_9CHLO
MQTEEIEEGSELEFVEGSEDYDEEYDEEYSEEEEEIDEGDLEEADEDDEGPSAQPGAEYIRGLHPLPESRAAPSRRPAVEPPKEWQGLHQLPAATQSTFRGLLGQLRDQSKQHLTILLLGKGNVGKSSTANSLFGERVAAVAAFQPDTQKPITISRVAAGFTLTVIDTPGLLEGDTISESTLSAVAFEIRNNPVDVVLFIDRLDSYRVEAADRQVMAGITRALGKEIWNNTIIGLTHGKMSPINMEYGEYAERRAEVLQAAIRKEGGAGKEAQLPVMLIENTQRATTNEGGEKTLPNGVAWLPELMKEVVKVALETEPYRHDPSVQARSNPNRRRKWLIPFVLAAQIAFKVLVLDRLMEDDGLKGDQYGPYDEDFIEEEKERRQLEKEAARRRKDAENARQARKKAASSAAAAAAAAPAQKAAVVEAVEQDEDEEYSDSEDEE